MLGGAVVEVGGCCAGESAEPPVGDEPEDEPPADPDVPPDVPEAGAVVDLPVVGVPAW